MEHKKLSIRRRRIMLPWLCLHPWRLLYDEQGLLSILHDLCLGAGRMAAVAATLAPLLARHGLLSLVKVWNFSCLWYCGSGGGAASEVLVMNWWEVWWWWWLLLPRRRPDGVNDCNPGVGLFLYSSTPLWAISHSSPLYLWPWLGSCTCLVTWLAI
jgi:hypothetical protein